MTDEQRELEKIIRTAIENGADVITVDMTKLKPSVYHIPAELYERLLVLGMLPNDVRDHNQGASDYAEHLIQPWAIWIDWQLNPWDADIIKRVLRTKKGESRTTAYEKIIHICQERIRQIEAEER